jgi:hypothetical protein
MHSAKGGETLEKNGARYITIYENLLTLLVHVVQRIFLSQNHQKTLLLFSHQQRAQPTLPVAVVAVVVAVVVPAVAVAAVVTAVGVAVVQVVQVVVQVLNRKLRPLLQQKRSSNQSQKWS